MRFHWYWPFARTEELEWARDTLRPAEEMVVEVIDRSEAPQAGTEAGVTVLRDLPDVNRSVGRLAWVPSRAATYRARASIRRQHWRSGDFDLFHVHYVNRFTDAFAPLPRPFVMSVHDVMPHVPRLGALLEQRLLARLYDRPDALVVHHVRLADELRRHFGIAGEKIHVVPHQVFPTGSVIADPPDGAPTVLFFGALRPNKGLEVLDAAMQLLTGHDFRLVIAGRGDHQLERLALTMAARDGRISAAIGFATLERKRELFRSASLAVLPYTSFTSQSGVLHDAYGHGRPVVVTNVGALGTTVREEGTGLVVAPGDPHGLADAIVRMLEPAQWSNAAQECRRVAEERSPRATGLRLREVYDHVLR